MRIVSLRWSFPYFETLSFLVTSAFAEYVKVINGRCSEAVGVFPIGGTDSPWDENFDTIARSWCDEQDWCNGYMRYIGDDEIHCSEWCGRPQFCDALELSEDENWVSYVRSEFLEAKPSAADSESLKDSQVEAGEIRCQWPYTGLVEIWSREPSLEQVHNNQARAIEEQKVCRVLHHQRGQALPRQLAGTRTDNVFFHGVLSEVEEVIPFFTARTTSLPWLYSFDNNDFIGATLSGNAHGLGPKEHYLSLFYTSADSACDGKKPLQWGPLEAEEVFPGHVFVDDGSNELRRRAFNPYHFTVICGNADEVGFLPQVLVDAISFAAHPLIPDSLHKQLNRVFFHLQDATQPYTRIHPLVLEQYVENLYMDPDKNDAMYFKQSFLFLLQDLLRYRYRQSASHRLASTACGLCAERQRLYNLAKAAATHSSPRGVGIAICIMSRRSGHELRRAIRETWSSNLPRDVALNFFVGAVVESESVDVVDGDEDDVVQLQAPEAYKAVTLKAFAMLDWTYAAFPNLRFLVRADDDIYLRPSLLLSQLSNRPPITYMWGNFDHGSNPVRDPSHPHFNSYEQTPLGKHPLFGDIFPPYARGHLWAMSADLLAMIVNVWRGEMLRHRNFSLALASRLPHPDDPALGVALANLVEHDLLSLNLDDRDLNHFALNPSCNATYLNIHNRTWVVHHVDAQAMRCMWSVDSAAGSCLTSAEGDSLLEDCVYSLPDLCPCSMEVHEEVDDSFGDSEAFDYPRNRFNEKLRTTKPHIGVKP